MKIAESKWKKHLYDGKYNTTYVKSYTVESSEGRAYIRTFFSKSQLLSLTYSGVKRVLKIKRDAAIKDLKKTLTSIERIPI